MIQYDDRDLPKHSIGLATLRERNERLSTQHPNFTYSFYTESELPPWWVKVQLVKDKLTTIPEGDYVLWLDTDACIGKYDELYDLIVKTVMTISGQQKGVGYAGVFNAGVWSIKNCDVGKAIMEFWISKYYPEFFCKDESGNWSWDWNVYKFAGWTFEQGSFVENVYDKFKEHINNVCWTLINNNWAHMEALVHHFPGSFKDVELVKYLES